MGTWKIDATRKPGILWMVLEDNFTIDEMRAFVADHNAAVDACGDKDYRAFVDIRKLNPLPPDVTAVMEQCKRYSSQHANFRGSAVLATSATVAMQHRRTSMSGGVMDTELITEHEEAAWKHLESVRRKV
jgi:hypothetical protein